MKRPRMRFDVTKEEMSVLLRALALRSTAIRNINGADVQVKSKTDRLYLRAREVWCRFRERTRK